jgi:histone acetyltransferase (RNA polymerase elongator complex component)
VKIYPVFIPNAGCPHRCLFCAQDRTSMQRPMAAISEAECWLDSVLPDRGEGEIAFYGGSFTLLPLARQNHCLAMAGRFVAAGRVTGIRLSTRPDALDDSCVARLQAFGVTTVEIGCQSFHDDVLKAAGRGHTAADSVSAIRRCSRAGLQVGVQLMPGLPGGGAGEALQSLQRALELKPSFLRIYPTVVLEGTDLAALWENGSFLPWSLDEAVDICADMLSFCQLAGTPVIRLGLQADTRLEANLLAGPYHPAFGQLVRSRLWRRALARVGAADGPVCVNPVELSDALGHGGENRRWLAKRDISLNLKTDRSVARGWLRVSGQDLSLTAIPSSGGQYG